MKKAAFLFGLAMAIGSVAQAQQSCLVVGVTDGDTLKARCGAPGAYEQVTVRISEIDAPERRQPFGERSRQSLADLCFQAQAVISSTKTDRYGRTVARVECGGKDVALHQAQAGMAWWYTKYGTDKGIQAAEQRARASRAGLWADAAPVAPWDFRRPGVTSSTTAAPRQQLTSTSHDNTCYTGPRGGTYTITASGRKNYGGC
jgi:endonuclease YncB( thermonuclease family)